MQTFSIASASAAPNRLPLRYRNLQGHRHVAGIWQHCFLATCCLVLDGAQSTRNNPKHKTKELYITFPNAKLMGGQHAISQNSCSLHLLGCPHGAHRRICKNHGIGALWLGMTCAVYSGAPLPMLSPHGVSKPVFPTSTASARERAARLCRAGERGCRSRCSCHGPLCCFLGFIPNKRCLELSSRSQIELRPLLSFGRQSANLPLLKICRRHRCFCTMLCWTASQLPAACVASSCYGCRVRRPACRNHA